MMVVTMDSASALPTVGFVGLGRLGGPLAVNLAGSGYQVTGFDVNPVMLAATGLPGARSLATLADGSDVVLTCVRTADDLGDLLDGDTGLLAGLRPGSAVLDLSTVSPSSSARIAEMVEAAGSHFLRVAVSGSAQAAAARQVSFICSGREDVYERCLPILRSLGRSCVYVGQAEEARAMKIALNMLVGIGMAALVESVVLADSFGLDRGKFLDVVEQSAVGSPFFSAKAPALASRDYTPAASLALMLKDLNLALGAGTEVAVQLPVTELARDLYARCHDLGWSERDFACLTELYEKQAAESS
jgi:3-hydroxyisobutyrate dehydrogenase